MARPGSPRRPIPAKARCTWMAACRGSRTAHRRQSQPRFHPGQGGNGAAWNRACARGRYRPRTPGPRHLGVRRRGGARSGRSGRVAHLAVGHGPDGQPRRQGEDDRLRPEGRADRQDAGLGQARPRDDRQRWPGSERALQGIWAGPDHHPRQPDLELQRGLRPAHQHPCRAPGR
ncbi:hypothetical protein G6F40_014853 [Rhizopus arrhizus]|nr:hypothetical protein G6F40_014853 [Rhizopus arrhizus]